MSDWEFYLSRCIEWYLSVRICCVVVYEWIVVSGESWIFPHVKPRTPLLIQHSSPLVRESKVMVLSSHILLWGLVFDGVVILRGEDAFCGGGCMERVLESRERRKENEPFFQCPSSSRSNLTPAAFRWRNPFPIAVEERSCEGTFHYFSRFGRNEEDFLGGREGGDVGARARSVVLRSRGGFEAGVGGGDCGRGVRDDGPWGRGGGVAGEGGGRVESEGAACEGGDVGSGRWGDGGGRWETRGEEIGERDWGNGVAFDG